MPASRSPRRDPRSPQAPGAVARSRRWPMIVIGLAAILAAIVATLPASIAARFLPPGVVAEEFSGSVWHGSAGKIRLTGRDAGALEWWLHPAPLLGMTLSADIHWVKVGFVIDGTLNVDRHGFAAHGIKGGGPIEDLRDLGVAAGWRGIAEINLSKLQGDFASPHSAVGDLKVSNLTAAQFADGANLGGYLLQIPQDRPAPTIARAARSPIPADPWRRRSPSATPPRIAPSFSPERCASAPRRRLRYAASCKSRAVSRARSAGSNPRGSGVHSLGNACVTPCGRNSVCCRPDLENSRHRNQRRADPPVLRPWRRVQGPCGAMHRPWPGCRPLMQP